MTYATSIRVSLLLACLVAACGGQSQGDSGLDAPPLAESSEPAVVSELGPAERVAQFRVDGTTVTFWASGESADAAVLLSVQGDGSAENPLDQLFEEYGVLTNLELFLAFAPEAEPPPALVVTHAGAARALGRPDDSIIAVEPLAGVIVEL